MNTAIAAGTILIVSSIFVVLGLGGGILFVPILHWSGFDLQTVAIPLALMLNGLNTLLSLIPYGRAGLVDWRGGWPMAVSAAVAAPLGALIQPHLASGLVLCLFAGAISIAAWRALRIARRGGKGKKTENASHPQARLILRLAVGTAVGFIGGLLGIGAGFVVAPTFMALGYSPQATAATTALVVTVCSFAGLVGYVPNLNMPLVLVLPTVIAVVAGSQIGARLMVKGVKPALITWGYVAILSAVAIKLVWEAMTVLLV